MLRPRAESAAISSSAGFHRAASPRNTGSDLVKALGEEPVKIGLNDPFTGTYAQTGKNEQIGCQMAIDEINAKGGILGRKVPRCRSNREEPSECRHGSIGPYSQLSA